MTDSRIGEWLQQAGLGKYRGNFLGMSEDTFLNLLMQEYGKYGVTDPSDKHALFKLTKLVRQQLGLSGDAADASSGHHQQEQLHAPGDLLDLDAHDGDLLEGCADPSSAFGLHVGTPGGQVPEDPPKIKVVVRKRPISRKEKEKGDEDIVEVSMSDSYVLVNEVKVKVDLTKYTERHQFNFDESLDENVSNDQVYRKTVQPLVHTLFQNGKATCFAYGQTGSGKTYTMSPLPIRAAADILQYLARPEYSDVSLFVSCFEIYGNKVFDLLNSRKKLNILEDAKKKVVVVGLKEHVVGHVDLVKQLIEEANHRRSVGSTAANADSSRSHSIMQFALKRFIGDGAHCRLVSKISFIDLAGSERGADTFDNNRQTRLEGAEINKSLLALKECIRALDCDARHVPFRGSKLTAVLRDSFIGDTARTVMIANISPTATCVEHTLNTLRYADRVKELRKDKAERAPGGVTPGDEDYYASVVADARPAGLLPGNNAAGVQPFVRPNQQQQQQQPQQQPNRILSAAAGGHQRHGSQGGSRPSGGLLGGDMDGDGFDGLCGDDNVEDLMLARDDLMDSILQDEEEIIAMHRQQIEDSMDIVRREMAMLAEVDQPGSAIDQYVDTLEAMLTQKADSIRALQLRLERFKAKLRQEEVMSTTVQKKISTIRRT